jgi:hypothetical protein
MRPGEIESVKKRGAEGNGMVAQINASIIERVTEPATGTVNRDEAQASEVGK